MGYVDIRDDWRLNDISQKADRAVSRLYEIDALRSDVRSLEHSLREARDDIVELRSQISTLQDQIIRNMQEQIDALINGAP